MAYLRRSATGTPVLLRVTAPKAWCENLR